MVGIIGLGQDRQLGNREGQVAHEVALESVDHGAVACRFGGHHVTDRRGEKRVSLFLQQIESEHHIVHRDRTAVMKPRAVTQAECNRHAVRRDGGGFCRQAIHGVRLVPRAGHQRIEGEPHAMGARALEHEDVEGVESEETLVEIRLGGNQPQLTALRCGGVGVVEMREPGVIFQVAENRHAVAPLSPIGSQAFRLRRTG